jgi:hypothetical protein
MTQLHKVITLKQLSFNHCTLEYFHGISSVSQIMMSAFSISIPKFVAGFFRIVTISQVKKTVRHTQGFTITAAGSVWMLTGV